MDNPEVDFTSSFTLACWVYSTRQNTTPERLIDKNSSAGYALSLVETVQHTSHIDLPVIGSVSVECSDGTNYCRLGGQTVIANQFEWFHVVATFDSGELNIYINGNQENSLSTPFSSIGSNDLNLSFGINESDFPGTQAFSGALSEVAVFDYALSPTTIRSLYVASLPDAVLDTESSLVVDYIIVGTGGTVLESLTVAQAHYQEVGTGGDVLTITSFLVESIGTIGQLVASGRGIVNFTRGWWRLSRCRNAFLPASLTFEYHKRVKPTDCPLPDKIYLLPKDLHE